MKDQIEGSIDEKVGAAKSTIGEQTGNEQLQNEGLAQQAEGNMKKAVGEVKDRLDATIDHVKDALL